MFRTSHWLTKGRAEIGMGVFGMIALMTPLLLWVAWSPEVLRNILLIGLGSLAMALFFVRFACPDKGSRDRMKAPDYDLHPTNMGRTGWRDQV
ncbi:MAG: hypothetical protein HOL85_09635 [Rhodospirillaceae bacterium]|mgnify:CR=1 FL=1|jgi:hypothetical protein|nr:hypothetical protein [Rhodospirillaceae bacterium]MBT6136380.1 hypothetical protein [Rhodospirillaceae bacterium]